MAKKKRGEKSEEVQAIGFRKTYSEMVEISLIHANEYNCNVMSDKDLKNLIKGYKKLKGPEDMEAVLLRTTDRGRIIVDGHHRVIAAKEGRTEENPEEGGHQPHREEGRHEEENGL